MPHVRYLEAEICGRSGESEGGTVFIPLGPDQDDTPATLVDPLLRYRGSWARESDRHVRPARYVRVA